MHLPLAQSGLSFLIYLIVGIFWLVGNISQQKKAKQRAEEMKRRREEREREEARTGKKAPKPHPLENDLETFLGRLAGEHVAPPPPPPRQEPKAIRDEIQFDQHPPPPRRPVAEPENVPKTNIGSIKLANSYEEIKDIKDALEISYDQIEGQLSSQTLETFRQVVVDLSPTIIDFARLPVQRMRTVDATTKPPALKTRAALKRAVLADAIIGPPIALQNPHQNER